MSVDKRCDMQIQKVWFDAENIYVKTDTGVTVGNPLSWFPRLANASIEERADYETSPFGIHWEKLDEDLSLQGFFEYRSSQPAADFAKP